LIDKTFFSQPPFLRNGAFQADRCIAVNSLLFFSACTIVRSLEGDCLGFGLAFYVCFCFSRVSSGISHFLSFFPVLKHFGKGFDGCGKLCLWLK